MKVKKPIVLSIFFSPPPPLTPLPDMFLKSYSTPSLFCLGSNLERFEARASSLATAFLATLASCSSLLARFTASEAIFLLRCIATYNKDECQSGRDKIINI
jgi:hypothetical protein